MGGWYTSCELGRRPVRAEGERVAEALRQPEFYRLRGWDENDVPTVAWEDHPTDGKRAELGLAC